MQGPFVQGTDPVSGDQMWIASGPVPSPASLAFPYTAGDRITALLINGRGTGGAGGLDQIMALYQAPSSSQYQVIGSGADLGRPASWGQVRFDSFTPTDLADGGHLLVMFTVTEQGYGLSNARPVLERPCPMH
jgi:hypothetical protein